ncbi:XdhC family protein [Maribacter sp. 2307ULW6-5]|uniref:XdhC family protein n=1 Tax=Maribacter sp. 2307ULW6-5 TaxID=3386275 RepID=UPI0039BCED49
MTHELKDIIAAHRLALQKQLSAVLATVVALDGSSYRRPGVRMLLLENGEMVGALSGGCVEQEVAQQARSVFETKEAKVITYDGRFRLGCDGILYILLEHFSPSKDTLALLDRAFADRLPVQIKSSYQKQFGVCPTAGTEIRVAGHKGYFNSQKIRDKDHPVFEQTLPPLMRLLILGSEHDSAKLAQLAAHTGWEVIVGCPPQHQRRLEQFPGAKALWEHAPEDFPAQRVDDRTAVVLMTHGYVTDLKYLWALRRARPMYFGVLGPLKRKHRLVDQFMERYPGEDLSFFEGLHGPVGLNIGAETPEEIAISILAEILAVARKQDGAPLSHKKKGIHQ